LLIEACVPDRAKSGDGEKRGIAENTSQQPAYVGQMLLELFSVPGC
jgi:hypothetical protein